MKKIVLLLCCTFVLACGKDADNNPTDAGNTTPVEEDMNVSPKTDMDVTPDSDMGEITDTGTSELISDEDILKCQEGCFYLTGPQVLCLDSADEAACKSVCLTATKASYEAFDACFFPSCDNDKTCWETFRDANL